MQRRQSQSKKRLLGISPTVHEFQTVAADKVFVDDFLSIGKAREVLAREKFVRVLNCSEQVNLSFGDVVRLNVDAVQTFESAQGNFLVEFVDVVKQLADWVSSDEGGCGAVREAAEYVMEEFYID